METLMITYLKGKLIHKNPAYVIIDVQGIGYHVHISLHTYGQLADTAEVMLHTYFRPTEDAHLLYGFAEESERKLFVHLISVSGIGLNTARLMLSSLSPTELEHAILSGDATTIQRIKGIGTKTAQKAVIELQDKLLKDSKEQVTAIGAGKTVSSPTYNNARVEALQALTMLGFTRNAAETVLNQIAKNSAEPLTVEQYIKLALKQL